MWPILAALASTVAGYGLNRLFGSGQQEAPKMPNNGTFATNKLDVPQPFPTQPTPLQFKQRDPYQTPNLDAATQRAIDRYLGR